MIKYFVVLLMMFAGNAIASDADIAERIKKVGEVCIEGDDCASGAVTVAAAGGGDIEATYRKTCATCHNTGVSGAPKLGDTAAWASHIAKGMDVLYNSAINGVPGTGMTPRGACFACSDDELRALVDYMVEESQ